MDTFRDSLIDHLRSWLVLGQHRDAPCLLHERKHQVVADKRTQQVDVICQYGREAIFHGSANFAIVFRGVSGSSVSVSSAESQLACSPLERKRLPGKRNSNSANGRVPLFFS